MPSVNSVLAERMRTTPRAGVVPALAIHAAFATLLIAAPALTEAEPEPFEFVAVTVIPAAQLGVREPAPPAPRRPEPVAPAATPEPDPEPQRPEPENTLPPPEPKRTPPAPKPAASDRGPERGAADSGPTRRQGSPTGSSTGTSAFGAAVAGLDNPDFRYSYYLDQMLSMIGAAWQRPSLGGSVEGMVHFRIARDGSVSELRIEQSSGFNSFDLAGLRAVRNAAPFPPLPQSFSSDSLGVNLILR